MSDKYEDRRKLEMERGQAVLAANALAARFDPDWRPEPYPTKSISPEERARRNEYRRAMGARIPR